MRNTLKKLKKTARGVRLGAMECVAMREVLVRHMKGHPAMNAGSSVSPFSLFDIKKKKAISAFLIGSILMGGTVSFAAENTVPGDVLYPVKVRVNESVRGVIAVSPKAKAEWDVRLVERRLEEVEMLAVASSSPESQEIAKENFEHYAERAKTRIAEFEEGDHEEALRVAGNFSDALHRHEEKIAKISADKGATVDMVVSTTTRGVVTTTTTTTVRNESLRGTLKKVRETRDHADEKHKELKKKKDESSKNNEDPRPREEVRMNNTLENISVNVSATTTAEEFTKKKEKNTDKKFESLKNKERDRKEELRAMPTITSTPTKENREMKKDTKEDEEKTKNRD